MTRPSPSIEIRLQLDAPFAVILDLEQPFPLRTQLRRERIHQTECDKLDKARLVAVGQITALVPAQRPTLNLVLGKRT